MLSATVEPPVVMLGACYYLVMEKRPVPIRHGSPLPGCSWKHLPERRYGNPRSGL